MERLEKLENESIIELANRMLAKRQETGNEVESQIYGIPITTENCQTTEDIEVQLLKVRLEIYENNADAAKNNYLMAAFSEQFKKRDKGPRSPILVMSARAEALAREEQEKREKASDEFYHNFMTKNDIDWNDSNEVYGWMNELVEGINNFDATLPLNEIYSEEELKQLQEKYNTKRLSSAQAIVDELKKHGYTGDKIEINNVDDFNRQYIANYINEIENYGMIITEKYVDVLKEDAKGAEEEIIDVVYRQAQDILAASQDQNIDYEAFNEQKTAIDEELSEVARRRKEINYALDVAKVLPSLEIIANATTAIQVSTDIKKEDLEAKLADIEKNFSKTLDGNQGPTTPVSNQSEPDKDKDGYLSYDEDYKAKMDVRYCFIKEKAEQLIQQTANKIEQGNREQVEKYQNLVDHYKNQLKNIIENEAAKQNTLQPNYQPNFTKKKTLRPKIDESFLRNTAGQFNIAEEQQAKQAFLKINSNQNEKLTQEELEEFKEAIDNLKSKNSYSIYLEPLEKALNEFTQYYNQENNPVPIERPKIDESFLRNTAGQFNIAEEQQAKQAFLKINSNSNPEMSKEELLEFKEAVDNLREKNANSIYLEPLTEALQDYTDYYNSVNNRKVAELVDNNLSQNMQRPKLDESFLRNTAGQFNIAEEQQAKQAFLKINSNQNEKLTRKELDEFKEAIDRLKDKNANSVYLEPLAKSLNEFIDYYNTENGLKAPEKPKIDESFLRSTAGQFNIAEEQQAKQVFYKINNNPSDEISAEDLINFKQSLDDLKHANEYSVYLQPLNEALQKFANYKIKYDQYLAKQAQQPVNNNRKQGLEAIYTNVSKLEQTTDQVERKAILDSINNEVKEMLTSKTINNSEVENIKALLEGEQNLLSSKAKKVTINFPIDDLDKELKDRIRNNESKEKVEETLRKIAQPIIDNLNHASKKYEANLNILKNGTPEEKDRVMNEYKKNGAGLDTSKLTSDVIIARLANRIQNIQAEKQDLEQKINEYIELYEKVKNKDYPDPKKDDSNRKKQDKQSILKLDDEEVDKLTEPNTKLRGILNSLKKQAKKVLNWIKEHPVKAAALLATTGIIGTIAISGISAFRNDKVAEVEKTAKEISQEADDELIAESPIASAVDEAIQQVSTETAVVDNNNIATQVLADEQARIATGSDAVYKDIHSAATQQNQLYAQSSSVQDIWQNTNVEAGKMYQVEADGTLSEINGVDALVQAGNEGKTIVSTWQNEDGTLARSVITPSEFGQSLENAEENTRTR